MEEKKPQESQMDAEGTEEAPVQAEAEVADAEIAEAESAEAEGTEKLVQTESVQAEAATEPLEKAIEPEVQTEEAEEPKETGAADVELTEEAPANKSGEESAETLENTEAAAVSEPVVENIPEETVEELPTSATAKPHVGGALAKWASTGLVIQSWQLAIAAVAVVAMVVGGVVLGVVLGNRNNAKDSAFDDSPVDYEWVMPEGGDTNEDQIILPGYVDLTFPAGEQEIEVVLPNPKGNPCYFRYTLMLEATGEILYQSKLIPPGKAVLAIKLSRPLPKGDYSLLIGIDSVSLVDGRTPMNGGEQSVLLKVR